jgi:hypothetical protein
MHFYTPVLTEIVTNPVRFSKKCLTEILFLENAKKMIGHF